MPKEYLQDEKVNEHIWKGQASRHVIFGTIILLTSVFINPTALNEYF